MAPTVGPGRSATEGVPVRKHRRGYTLFEAILVVALIGIAAAIVTPTLHSLYGDTPATAAADMVKARWAEARARAMAENRPYRFAVMENTGKLRIAPDAPEYWEGGDSSGTDTGEALIVEDTLPKEVRFVSPETAASGQALAANQNQGTGGEGMCP